MKVLGVVTNPLVRRGQVTRVDGRTNQVQDYLEKGYLRELGGDDDDADADEAPDDAHGAGSVPVGGDPDRGVGAVEAAPVEGDEPD